MLNDLGLDLKNLTWRVKEKEVKSRDREFSVFEAEEKNLYD